MSTLSVRAARRDDIDFLVAGNAALALETEHKTLDRDLLARGVAGVFEVPGRGFYLIAERDGERVGCLLITTEWSDWRCGDWWWIQSVYVMPQARRDGVFRTLYAQVDAQARERGDVVGLRLYVEWENTRAQQTYRALGMEQEHYHLFRRGYTAVD